MLLWVCACGSPREQPACAGKGGVHVREVLRLGSGFRIASPKLPRAANICGSQREPQRPRPETYQRNPGNSVQFVFSLGLLNAPCPFGELGYCRAPALLVNTGI